MNNYFIVLDAAALSSGSRAARRPTYELMFGDPETAIGVSQDKANDVESLLARVDSGEIVYRTFLQRTDGKTGHVRLR